MSKQDLLLFDRVLVMGLNRKVGVASTVDETLAADAEYLAEMDFLIEAPETPLEIGAVLGEHIPPDRRGQVCEAGGPLALVERIASSGRHPSASPHPLPVGGELVLSFALNAVGEHCAPVMARRPSESEWKTIRSTLAVPESMDTPTIPLLEVIIDALPTPGEDVSLEAVLDFCRDEDTRARRQRLILALARAQLDGRTPEDFSLNLEEALFEFEQHMRLSDMRARTSVVRLAIGTGLGVVEELIRLRPRRALNAVFEYRELRARRLEAELHARGSETAFLYQAEREFGSQDR